MVFAKITDGLVLGLIGIFTTFFGTQDLRRDELQAQRDTQELEPDQPEECTRVVANRLSEKFKVLLLEAGGEPNPLHKVTGLAPLMVGRPMVDWNYMIEPQNYSCFAMKNKQVAWPRGKSLGGSSNLNFMVYARGHPNDFDNWANITGDPRWSYENVLPFFKESESYQGEWDDNGYHSQEGEMKVRPWPRYILAEQFVRAGQELGYPHTDLNANYTEGFSKIYSNQYKGRRWSTYAAFIKPARKRSKLTIYKFAHVTKVLINEGSMRAYGVEYVRHGKKQRAFATKEVVLSAGVLSSPKILMLSGIGPSQELNKFNIPVVANLPVGENLHDHVGSTIGPIKFGRPGSSLEDFLTVVKAVKDYSVYGTGPLSSFNFQATAFLVAHSSFGDNLGQGDWPNEQLIWSGTDIGEFQVPRFSSMRDDLVKTFYDPNDDRLTFFVLNYNVRPFSRGRAKLQSKDPRVPLALNPNYMEDPRDIRVLIDSAKTAMKLIQNTTVFQKLGTSMWNKSFPSCNHHEFLSDEYWECYHRSVTVPGYHQAGTCSMGRSDSPHAVVDSQLRVIGIQGLRVADASVMPQVVTANTHAATTMIGEMASHLILSDL